MSSLMGLELPGPGKDHVEGDATTASAAEFDLDALFEEQEEEARPAPRKRLYGPQVPSYKRPAGGVVPTALLKPGEQRPLKRPRQQSSPTPPPSIPALLLPEDVVDLPVPPASPSAHTLQAIKQLKERMISAHTLLTTYTVLQKTSGTVHDQLSHARAQLADASKWRELLAEENARLKSRVSIVTKEKENLRVAIKRLHADTNGLQKNEALKNEIMDKNREIARL